jgi:hypothetical protein
MHRPINRSDIEDWLAKNPLPTRVDVRELLDRCESAVRRHAREDAWIAAKRFAEDRARAWHGTWSPPASEVFVTTEVCHELAWELQHHEPEVREGDEEHLAGGPVREALPDESWAKIRAWVHDLAVEAEHRAWREIVRYTDRRAKDIIRRQGFTRDTGWDENHRYSEIASHVAEILAREYSLQAHPR